MYRKMTRAEHIDAARIHISECWRLRTFGPRPWVLDNIRPILAMAADPRRAAATLPR